MSQVFHRAATATIALLPWRHICAAQDQSQGQSAWSNFSDKVKNGFSSVTGSLTPKPHDTPADDPTALSSKSKVGPELHVAMARLCEVRKMPGEAVEHYQQALVEDPKYLPALIGFARLRVHTGELEEATRLYETAAKAFPKEASVFNDLGLCYAQRGMFEKATAAIDEAIRLQPTLVLYRNNIAMVLVDLGRIELAYSHLAAVHPEAVAHYNLGYFLFKKGQSGEAVRQFAIAVQKGSEPGSGPAVVTASAELAGRRGGRGAVATGPAAADAEYRGTAGQRARLPYGRAAADVWVVAVANAQLGPPESSHAVVGPLDPDTERHKILRLPDVAAESADPPLPPEGLADGERASPVLPLSPSVSLHGADAAIEGVLLPLVQRQGRLERRLVDPPFGLLIGVCVAMRGEHAIHELEQVPRHAERGKRVLQPAAIDGFAEQLFQRRSAPSVAQARSRASATSYSDWPVQCSDRHQVLLVEPSPLVEVAALAIDEGHQFGGEQEFQAQARVFQELVVQQRPDQFPHQFQRAVDEIGLVNAIHQDHDAAEAQRAQGGLELGQQCIAVVGAAVDGQRLVHDLLGETASESGAARGGYGSGCGCCGQSAGRASARASVRKSRGSHPAKIAR